MFYEPGKTSHGLPHDPFKACVVPRPIGWISTVSLPGANDNPSTGEDVRHNLAPYSQFNNLTFDPPYIVFSANQQPAGHGQSRQKDTVRNVEATGVFVWNLATWDLREAVNITAEQVPHGVDEFERAGLEKEFSQVTERVRVPMVKASPVKFECVYHTTLRVPGTPPLGMADVVIGRVVGVHIADWALSADGKLDVKKTLPIARCGYYEYTVLRETFEMIIPGTDEMILAGLEGSSARVDSVGRSKGKGSGSKL
ncbi:hypothetical protein B0H66DRAFT_467076 [Apodospora peruviana]|uniref:Flavin reductase like domain-containing protein n=1 Tax=Apodospora peruviana TaxID=516989 RepID=A0AAE0IRC8_9PEZI|nr:hypothetical protein B0H66DRAFT_467076 [Apodospora peruviana]